MDEEHVPKLSIVCPTVHGVDSLLRTYYSIQTQLDMEIIYIGPVNYLPEDLIKIPHRFIVSPVKPVQCCQIGMFLAKGETVGVMADDQLFSPYAWDEAYAMYKESNDYKTIVSMNWWEDQPTAIYGDRGNFKRFLKRFGMQLPNSCSAMSRKFFWELGGYDSRYKQRMFDMDLFIKALMNGAIVKYCEEKVGYGHIESTHSAWGAPSPEDMALYENRWALEDGGIVQKIEDRPIVMEDMSYTIYEGKYV